MLVSASQREERHDRLVDVEHVVAAVAQLAAQGEHRLRRECHVGDGAVGGHADGASERDEVLAARSAAAGARRGAAVAKRVIGVERRQDARFVPAGDELRCERLYVARDATWVRPRVRRQERDPHGLILYPPRSSAAGRGRGALR